MISSTTKISKGRAQQLSMRVGALSKRLNNSRKVWHQVKRFTSNGKNPARMLSSISPIQSAEVNNDQYDDYDDKEIWSHPRYNEVPRRLPRKGVADLLGRKQDIGENVLVRKEINTSPSHAIFTGDASIPITSVLHIVTPEDKVPRGTWPLFRLMDEDGTFRDVKNDGYHFDDALPQPIFPANVEPETARDEMSDIRELLKAQYPFHAAEIDSNAMFREVAADVNVNAMDPSIALKRAHRQMIRLRQMDDLFLSAQRQGRISFYMSCRGEEAIHFGSAAALSTKDTIFAQYREAGPLMWRGFRVEDFANQCFSNKHDLGLGRQMPVHYGSRALNYVTISSTLGTQLPQAVGAAYKHKLDSLKKDHNFDDASVTVCYFGDGAASTTDFHCAMNFAATLKVPIIFLCRNNGYAISTSTSEQYAGDGIVGRAPGYGIAGIRVDGNDIFAMSAAVRAARSYALENSTPVLLEAMTYRQAHHSTSDDSMRYRNKEELRQFEKSDPLKRLEAFMKEYNLDDTPSNMIQSEERSVIIKAMDAAENCPKPSLDTLFDDVYEQVPPHLARQKEQLMQHIEKYQV